MKTGKKITLAAMMAILAAAGYGGYTIVKERDLEGLRSGEVVTYKVARVIDGDTFELADKDVVRLLGIDAPEEGECYYEESKQALDKLLIGKEVELRKDVTATDDFGRLLRYAILSDANPLTDNMLVDEYMVSAGYAEPQSNPRDKLYWGILLERRLSEKVGECGTLANIIQPNIAKTIRNPEMLNAQSRATFLLIQFIKFILCRSATIILR